MKHSKAYLRFSERINQPDPELLLGPNWKAVLNFWLFFDTLSVDQKRTAHSLYMELNHNSWYNARRAAQKAAYEIFTDVDDYVWCATTSAAAQSVATLDAGEAWDVAWVAAMASAGYATYELIGSHILLHQNKPLTFLPMFLDL